MASYLAWEMSEIGEVPSNMASSRNKHVTNLLT